MICCQGYRVLIDVCTMCCTRLWMNVDRNASARQGEMHYIRRMADAKEPITIHACVSK